VTVRRHLRISGTVQGVGFRPYVRRLADDLGLTGAVGNDDAGVWCEVQGPEAAVGAFIDRLRPEAPPLARIDGLSSHDRPVVPGAPAFAIVASAPDRRPGPSGPSPATVPPDVAPCPACRAELTDPTDRRHRYPFTCCVDCGPRLSVVRSLPYDRATTSMAEFALCPACAAEYADPTDRRHHAQATCCPTCGPRLRLLRPDGSPPTGATSVAADDDPLAAAAALIDGGGLLALKGVGGYQLVCRADGAAGAEAVARLRASKRRDAKPFALLVASLDRARELIEVDDLTARALTGPEAPIVLAPRRPEAPVVAGVAPGTRLLGVMLPASPLHLLLTGAIEGRPLVCTSGNRSDEPMVIDDGAALAELGPIVDGLLINDRRIERRADDSIGRVVAGDFQLLRRARGFAPRPIRLAPAGRAAPGDPPVLAVGAELKSTVGLALAAEAHLSVHLGDLEHPAALAAFETAVADLLDRSGARPELVVHDLHPEYLSTKFALAVDLAPTLAVQHHHAHLVSCLVDNGHPGPAIGLTFDGLGFGPDGTLWGGEALVGDATGYRRVAHLRPVAQPGGAMAVTEPWRMAVAHLVEAFDAANRTPPDLPLVRRHRDAYAPVAALVRSATTITTSSMGRLFDAMAALCDLGDAIGHEGQAAMALEQAADPTGGATYLVAVDEGDPLVIDPRPMVAAAVDDLAAGVPAARVAGRFHHWLADVAVAVVGRVGDRTGLTTVACSGGVFQNRLLVELAVPALEAAGFDVLLHRQVPPNDGGIALGQLAIGRAHLTGVGGPSGR
jgi:hydrogenase maturation protein HypF